MTYPMQFVRPDFVTRTSVLQPTANGYQPNEAAQNVATQFTRIYGPTVWDWKQKGADAMRTHVYTQRGPMRVAGGVGADSNKQAIDAIAQAFARGQSVRIRDQRGHVAIAHPGQKNKHTFFEKVINKAKDTVKKATDQQMNGTFVRDHRMAPTVPARPRQISPAIRPSANPGVAIVQRHTRPQFNRQAAAANQILMNRTSALPNQSVWLPPYAGGRREDPRAANAAAQLAVRLTRGPQMVTRPAVANAMDAFRNTGRYF